jgi:hypothetical protein
MARIKILGVALVAAFALTALAAAMASAHNFSASKAGAVTDHSTSSQVFVTNGGTVTCTSETSKGNVPAGLALTTTEKVGYSGCTAFSFVGATISEAEYEFSADETVKVLNTIKISITGCTVTVSPSGNTTLKSVTYSDSKSDLKVNAAVSNITYTSSGGLCGTSGTNGKYTGESLVEESGGTLGWS